VWPEPLEAPGEVVRLSTLLLQRIFHLDERGVVAGSKLAEVLGSNPAGLGPTRRVFHLDVGPYLEQARVESLMAFSEINHSSSPSSSGSSSGSSSSGGSSSGSSGSGSYGFSLISCG